MCSAWLRWRFPRGLSRCRTRGPEEASNRGGAVVAGEVPGAREPADVADVAADDAGHDWADPEHLGDGRARGDHGSSEAGLRRGELRVEAADLHEEIERDPLAFGLDGASRADGTQRLGGSISRKSLRETAFDQLADQRVEPVDGLGAGPGQLVMSIGEQAQLLRVISGADLAELGVTHRDHRGGAGVMRVGLVVVARVQQPHPRRERRRDIDDGLAGGDQLLGEQRAEPGRGLDRPRARRERHRELEQPLALSSVRVDAELADKALGLVEHRGGV
jgi:hypothetical protein